MDFYSIKPTGVLRSISNFTNHISNSSFLSFYAFFSGTNTGYGFYSPNVKAGSGITVEINGEETQPQFNTHEGAHMFEVLIGSMTNQIIEENTQKGKKETVGNSKNIAMEMNELMLKNIGIYSLTEKNRNKEIKKAAIHYYMYDLSSLQDHIPGQKSTTYLKTKTIHLSKKIAS